MKMVDIVQTELYTLMSVSVSKLQSSVIVPSGVAFMNSGPEETSV